MPMSKVSRGRVKLVYEAYLDGCRNTFEVSEETGLPIQTAAICTVNLVKRGLLRNKGRSSYQPPGTRGDHQFHWYEPSNSLLGGKG